MQPDLKELIQQSTFLQTGDKDYLFSKLSSLTPLEKLRLKTSLLGNRPPSILNQLQQVRAKFMATEAPRKPDPITQAFQTVFKPTPPKPIAISILGQPQLLGEQIVPRMINPRIQALNSIAEIVSLEQLAILTPRHVSFEIDQNPEILLQEFNNKIETLFEPIASITERRSYLVQYLSSPLFRIYLKTGTTALNHPELQPSNIVLNTLYQIDSQLYLNRKQFTSAAIVNSYLRQICGL